MAACAALVVLAGGGVAWAATRTSGPGYRLASVTRKDVVQTVSEVGTLSSINRRSVNFPVSGTVAAVKVALGDRVTAGQTLATLDTTAFAAQVVSANGAIASARQRLADDEASQSTTTTDAYSASPLGGGGGGGTSGRGSGASVSQLQDVVVADQKAVDAGLAGVAADLTALKTACSTSTLTFPAETDAAGVIHGTVSGGAGLPISVPSDTDAAGNAIPPTTVGLDGAYSFGTGAPLRATASYTVQLGDAASGLSAITTCSTALSTTQHDEQDVASRERALAASEQKLDAAISELGGGSTSGGSQKSSGASTGSTSSNRSTSPAGASGKVGSATGSSTPATAAQLAADQKSIDAAAADLVVAERNLGEGTLAAPISGTVAAIGIKSGTSVSASSSTSTITIIGTGQKQVSTTVGIADVDLVKVGESVAVTVDGVSTALPGKVTQVGVLNTAGTSGSTTTYPVTIVLDPTDVALYDGAGVTVAIDVGAAKQVLTVPTSALTTLGSRSIVSVYANGKVTRTLVTTGVSGIDNTEIKTGLTAGEQVVLANLRQAVPTSTTSNRLQRLIGGAGGGLGTGLTSGAGSVKRAGN